MISIIIPVYNVEKYIDKCLQSIFNQTFKDYEVIIVNDGSTDNVEAKINPYVKKYKNIKYIRQKNQGVAAARNKGLANASGEYILFVDSDDFLKEDLLEKVHKRIVETNSDMVIFSYCDYYGENNNRNKVHKMNDCSNGRKIIDLVLEFKCICYACTKLFKKDLLVKHKFKFENLKITEEWYPVFKEICESKKINILDEPLYYYVKRDTSALSTISKNSIDDYLYSVKKIRKYLKENNVKYSNRSMTAFNANIYYTLALHYFKYYYGKLEISNIYDSFDSFAHRENIFYKKISFLQSNIDIKLKLKLILWKLRIFHLFYKKNMKGIKNNED